MEVGKKVITTRGEAVIVFPSDTKLAVKIAEICNDYTEDSALQENEVRVAQFRAQVLKEAAERVKEEWFKDRPRITWDRINKAILGDQFPDATKMMDAEPKESWEPVEGEWVAAWDDGAAYFVICRYTRIGSSSHYCTTGLYNHVARIIDGLDLRCTPEELKERTEWL